MACGVTGKSRLSSSNKDFNACFNSCWRGKTSCSCIPVVIKRMPQLMSVPMAAGITILAVVATTLPTGAVLPG